MMKDLSCLLVANRGEIACRIITTARAMGLTTVAVYTTADAQSPHVSMANTAVCIGEGPVEESYLCARTLFNAARQSGADCVHPGYGFLSENAAFAQACGDAGLTFIGPRPEAIALMGNKAHAKQRMHRVNVPCVPGYEGDDQSDKALMAAANEIGYPVMIKAASGGGGRGMRLVHQPQEIEVALQLARDEAQNAFGDGHLILEKAIMSARHVEIQICADQHGHIISFGERDCSIQRRHQKVIEEAPCPILSDKLRQKMSEAAITAARSIEYDSIGTVEFLLDDDSAFYFLEMNTRLQVEHAVTEMITGYDLVKLQIESAQGQPLSISQKDVRVDGHAIEVRLYAEDVARDFLPTAGHVHLWQPAVQNGIRVDSGIISGQDISPYYDPMLAKVVAFAPDRETARQRLVGALNNTVLFGLKNNSRFLLECLEKPDFINARYTTDFIKQNFDQNALQDSVPGFEQAALAAVLDVEYSVQLTMSKALLMAPALKGWSSAEAYASHRYYVFDDIDYALDVTLGHGKQGKSHYRVTCGELKADIVLLDMAAEKIIVSINEHVCDARISHVSVGDLYLLLNGSTAHFEDQLILDNLSEEMQGSGQVIAPMHGALRKIQVNVGDVVSKGQTLLIMEAMKMQCEVRAQVSGTVSDIFAREGEQVSAEQLLLQIVVSE